MCTNMCTHMLQIHLIFEFKTIMINPIKDKKPSIHTHTHTHIYIYIYTHPGEGNGNPLQYSCLENPMDRGLQSTGSQRVGHDWAASLSYIYIWTVLLILKLFRLLLIFCIPQIARDDYGPDYMGKRSTVFYDFIFSVLSILLI